MAFSFLLYCQIKVFCDDFGGFFHAVVDPPTESLNKSGADMIDPKIFRQFFIFAFPETGEL